MNQNELTGEMAVTDGTGQVYNLPPRLRVADCSKCKKLVVRDRERVPVHLRRFLNYIGGWVREHENHTRPVCIKCWAVLMRNKNVKTSE